MTAFTLRLKKKNFIWEGWSGRRYDVIQAVVDTDTIDRIGALLHFYCADLRMNRMNKILAQLRLLRYAFFSEKHINVREGLSIAR